MDCTKNFLLSIIFLLIGMLIPMSLYSEEAYRDITFKIMADANDVTEDSSGNIYLSGNKEVGFGNEYWSNGSLEISQDYSSFYRWISNGINQGDIINSAILTLYLRKNKYNEKYSISTKILGINEDNTAVFSATEKPSLRPRTTANIVKSDWGKVKWRKRKIPVKINVTSIVQEIVNRAGFSEGNAIGMAHINNGSHNAYGASHEFSSKPAYAAKLKISHTTSTTITPPSPPPIDSCTDGGEGITDYYVAPDGNDSLHNGSQNCPFKTIKHGLSLLKPGDKLILLAGHYPEKNLKILNSGTVEQPITIMAETAGSVFLAGDRPVGMIEEEESHGYGFQLSNISNIIIDGIHFSNFIVGVSVYGDTPFLSKNITIKNSTFTNNSDAGIQNWQSNNLHVVNCRFISLVPVGGWSDPSEPSAIQDYGVAIYHSKDTIVEESYFYGAHNQALSFKYGCHNSTAKRNIFAGNLYTAIYLGQGSKTAGRPISTNLLVEDNIIRPAIGYRLKNPITVMNAKNSTIRHNYIDGFGLEHNTTGISVFKGARDLVNIHDNIVAFSFQGTESDPSYSSGVYLADRLAEGTKVIMENNTFYALYYEFQGRFTSSRTFDNNIVWSCKNYAFGEPAQSPDFVGGDPIQYPLDSEPTVHDFDSYYNALTTPFEIQ